MSVLKILIDGKESVLEAINSSQSIVRIMYEQVELCPDFGKVIISKKILGEGAFGEAMLVEIEGKNYVVKRVQMENISIEHEVMPCASIRGLYEKLSKKTGVPVNILRYYNPDGPKFFRGRKKCFMRVPKPLKSIMCLTKKEKHYLRHDGHGITIVPPGSYICKKETYSEFAIAALLAQTLDPTKIPYCENFVNTFGFAACSSDKNRPTMNINNYIFMEQMSGDLVSLIDDETADDDVNSIVIQLLFAIAYYQKLYKISHNDLHSGNIFLDKITEDHKYYPYDDFYYMVQGQKITFPRGNYLVKLGDFGLSVKWSIPIVGFENIFETLSHVPNWYSQFYDLYFGIEGIDEHYGTQFTKHLFEYILDGGESITNLFGGRPILEKLKKYESITAEKVLLESDLMEKYRGAIKEELSPYEREMEELQKEFLSFLKKKGKSKPNNEIKLGEF